jgi:hypothetical protein
MANCAIWYGCSQEGTKLFSSDKFVSEQEFGCATAEARITPSKRIIVKKDSELCELGVFVVNTVDEGTVTRSQSTALNYPA